MDVGADSETPPTHTSLGEPVLEQELNLCCAHAQTESGGNISLQLLAFRTQLLEAVEELHIRRDAETRFEAQISKTVLEKQELEWEKESLQHRFESVTNQHTESLTNLKKQFQAKLRNTEEEKGKHQVIAALKDKEINNLKEELKSLQLQKYNLEKKSSELEQKLALQSRTKDSHLNQLGEVEKRFSALSRQCAVVKQAHEKLEQNVDEAMRINKKLTSANERQEVTIVLLKKELDEVSNELTKAKMTVVRHGEPRSPAGGEREHVRQLQQRLTLETEMNERLREENEAERAEKQEVIRSLQHSQQLLLSQTQIVRRGDVELQTQRRMYEGLKQEHEVMREKSKAVEDKVAELMESYEASRTSWDKERTRLLDRIKNEQEDLRALKEAYDDLHQKHTELSSQAQSHAQHIQEMEVRGSRQALGVSTRPARVDEIRGEEPLGEPVHRSELPGLGALQHSISSQAKNPAAAAATLTATEATEGQKVPKQQSQTGNGPLSRPDTPCCPVATNGSLSLGADSGSAATDAVTLNRTVNSAASERSPDARPDVTSTALPVSDDGVQIIKGCCVSGITASSPECSSLTESLNLLTDMKSKDGNTGMNESEQEEDDGTQGNGHREEEEANMGQQRDEEGVQGEDVEEGGGAGEKRAAGDRRTRGEDSEGSAEDAETETKDRASGVKERAKTAAHTPQTQIRAQTITDSTAEKSPPLQVTDSTDAEPPPHVCEPSDVCQNVSGTDAECKHLRNQREAGRDGEYQSVCRGQREVTGPCSLRDAESRNHQSGFHLPETTRDKPLAKTAGEFSAPANRHSGGHAGGHAGGHSGGFAGAEELGTSQTQAEVCDPSVIPDMKQTDEKCDSHTSENVSEAEQLSQGGTEQKDGRSDYSACKGGEGQSDACESRRTPVEKSHYKEDVTMDTINLECEVETERIQEAADAKKSGGEPGVKLPPGPGQGHRRPASGETLLGDSADSSLPRRKTLGPLFDWGAAERQTPNSRAKSGGSGLHQLIQGSSLCEPTGGFPGRPPSATIPTILRSKLDDVPSAIVRASDLLDAGSVSGTAPSLRRRQQGLWEAKEERCRERTAAETVTKVLDGRARLPGCSFPASSTGSKLPRPTAAACSRAPTLAAGASSESDWKLSRSHEREDQQASFRAQISKIEQLLNAEELRLPKRQRTEPSL